MAVSALDRKVLIPVIAILVVTIIALLIRFVFIQKVDVNAKVSNNKLVVGEAFAFEDNSSHAEKWKWEFGDGVVAYERGGQYRYSAQGNYKVRLTINDLPADSFFVTVRDTTTVQQVVVDSLIRIEGPAVAMQFENLIFRATGDNATLFRWEFGDAKRSDTRDPFVFHTFEQPGDYVVRLTTNSTQYPVRLAVKVLPAYQAPQPTAGPMDKMRQSDDDFKYHLQQIADHKDFDYHYNYLVNRYLCGNEKVVVTVNGDKFNEFWTYCSGLHYDRNIFIAQAKVSMDTALTCVTRVEISQQQQNL